MIVNDYNITADNYLALYERYLHRSPDELLLVAGDIKGKRVLDLCCGTMRASNRAKELGASYVAALDNSRSIIPQVHKADDVIICDVNDLCRMKSWGAINLFVHKVDLVICQQAINYWFNDKNIRDVSLLIKDNGHFVFNTFNTQPSKEPTIKQYGGEFTEVIQSVDDTVYHLQMRKGYVPHFTSFKYLPEDDIENVINAHFCNFKSIVDGATTIYICER